MLAKGQVREGPFGEFVGFSAPEGDAPILQITAVTHRAKPIYHAINGYGRETVMLRKYVLEASLLKAVGLPELVTDSLADYEALTAKLAGDPPLLRAIRDRLAENRASQPLFDMDRLCRHIEAAYRTMWDIHARGERPQNFAVAALQ